MFHTCDIIPSNTSVADDSCAEYLSKEYSLIKVIDSGKQGVVIKVTNKEKKELAIKLIEIEFESQLREVNVSCKLNNLSRFTPIFTRTHGWLYCNKLPESWETIVKNERNENDEDYEDFEDEPPVYQYLVLIMTYYEINLRDVIDELSSKELKRIMFILLHGIAQARKQLGFFEHGDIIKQNIMLVKNTSEMILDNSFRVIGGEYIPKLIDYDTVSLDPADNRPSSDVLGIFKIFDMPFSPSFKSKGNDYESIYNLLSDPFFHDILIRTGSEEETKAKKLKLTNFCIICGNMARLKYHNKPSYIFCSPICEESHFSFILKQMLPNIYN